MQRTDNSKWLLLGLAALTSLSLAAEVELNDPTRPYKNDG